MASPEGAATGEPCVVVAVAASAGGVGALSGFVRSLPADFPGVVLVVLHLPETGPSVLPSILARAGSLRVIAGEQGTPLEEGLVVVAPPGHHLRVQDGVATLDHGPRENGHRPSADALFRSVAERFGPRAAGVVLSGTMDDGAAGLRVIGEHGGLTVVQDPAEAAFPGMPRAAILEAQPILVCPVETMGGALARWAEKVGPAEVGDPPDEPDPPEGGPPADAPARHREPTELTCPECGGTLWSDDSYETERFRCRVGHAFSARSLLVGKQDAVESALWASIVALEERADLARRVLRRLGSSGRPSHVQRYREDVEQAAGRIEVLRSLIDGLGRDEPLPADIGMEGDEEHDGRDITG